MSWLENFGKINWRGGTSIGHQRVLALTDAPLLDVVSKYLVTKTAKELCFSMKMSLDQGCS